MSKYTTNKYGIIVGSDNIFFYRDRHDVLHEFKSALWIDYPSIDIKDENARYLNDVKMPIHYLIVGYDDGVHIKPWVKYWLNQNTPDWGITWSNYTDEPQFFFKKVTHAWAFRKRLTFIMDSVKFNPSAKRK